MAIASVSTPHLSYDAELRSLARARDPAAARRALLLFRSMLSDRDAPPPGRFSFPPALAAAAFLPALSEGLQLHALTVKLSLFPSNPVVSNSVVHFYSSCGRIADARSAFDQTGDRTRVSWNTIIDGYVANGDHDTALSLFRAMQPEFAPDAYTLQSVITACAASGALTLGLWVHAMMTRMPGSDSGKPVPSDVLINNSLVDLYAKCGAIDLAQQVFDAMPERDRTSWNVLILGLAAHGRVRESLDAFRRMREVDGIAPNAITFVGVLSACNHGGLVADGRRYFDSMVRDYNIRPRIEHYGCLVDILARAGLVDEALDVVSGMKCPPDAVIWRSLLDACSKGNGGVELSETVARQALRVADDAASGIYVLLSRVYASAERWNDVGMVRRLMCDAGVRKEPGWSTIEKDGAVHQFVAGDTSHPESKAIYQKLDEMERRLAGAGYAPDASQAPMVAGAECVKERSLRHHSEKLAIALGLLEAAPGETIRVLKNLRVCRDCHAMAKAVSELYDVEITLRDRIRFHHFKAGVCSCNDYW